MADILRYVYSSHNWLLKIKSQSDISPEERCQYLTCFREIGAVMERLE